MQAVTCKGRRKEPTDGQAMKKTVVEAHAKINLALDVLRRREDGYHEVRMIMQTISLCDVVELEVGVGKSTVSLSNSTSSLPTDDRNLAVRAAKLLMEEFDIRENLQIRLTKRIPVAAGLAGGSADAAAVLRGMNHLFDLGLSREELMARGARLGADVPFCVMGGTALAEGIGEKLTELPDMPGCSLVIAKPGVEVSTEFVYTNLKLQDLPGHPDVDGMIKAIREQNFAGVAGRLDNVLETVTCPRHPEIERIKDRMRSQGAAGVLMSGSGPTVFGLFEDAEAAAQACRALEESEESEVTLLAVPQGREVHRWQ